MTDWNTPSVSSIYTDVLTYLKARDAAAATMFDGYADTNIPTNTKRWAIASGKLENWDGAEWDTIFNPTDYLTKAGNLSGIADAATARSNLGLGAVAVCGTPLGLAYGGTNATSASDARTQLGLGTIATQAASAVAITGGTLSGITSLTMTSSSTFSMTSSGTISAVEVFTTAFTIQLRTTGSDYAIYFQTNNTTRCYVNSNGLTPYANNTYNLGYPGYYWANIYAVTAYHQNIDYAGDINIKSGGTTFWVFGSGANKDFRPNSDNSQLLGYPGYYWQNGYINNVIGSGELFLWSNSGTAYWKIETSGKINPVTIGRAVWDYGAYTTRRVIGSSIDTIDELRDCVITLLVDLNSLGLISAS